MTPEPAKEKRVVIERSFGEVLHEVFPGLPQTIIQSAQQSLITISPFLKPIFPADIEGAEMIIRGSVAKNLHKKTLIGPSLPQFFEQIGVVLGDIAHYPSHWKKAIQSAIKGQDVDICFYLAQDVTWETLRNSLGFNTPFEDNNGYALYTKKDQKNNVMVTWRERKLEEKAGPIGQAYLEYSDLERGQSLILDLGEIPKDRNFVFHDRRLGLASSMWDLVATLDLKTAGDTMVVAYPIFHGIMQHPDKLIHLPSDLTGTVILALRILLNNYVWSEGLQDSYSMEKMREQIGLVKAQGHPLETKYEIFKNFIKLSIISPDLFIDHIAQLGIGELIPLGKYMKRHGRAKTLDKLRALHSCSSQEDLVEALRLLDPFIQPIP